MTLRVIVENPPVKRANHLTNAEQFSACDLVMRIEQGDKNAESELFSSYCDKLHFILQSKFNDRELCRDIHQEAFTTVIEKIRKHQLREPEKLASFLHSTAINLALMSIRRNARMIPASDTLIIENVKSRTRHAFQDIELQEMSKIIVKLINELEIERDRKILMSFYITQLDKPQICQQLNLNTDQFDKVVYRSKQRLKKLLLSPSQRSIFDICKHWFKKVDNWEKHV